MIKAKWLLDYDMHTDSNYLRPTCPVCETPIFETDGMCRCCDKPRELDKEMTEWIADMNETKEESGQYCFKCDKNTMTIVYHRNHVTREFLPGHGKCDSCGCRFIV